MSIDLPNTQSAQQQNQRSLWEIFRVPVALAALSGVGLVSALVGDHGFDWFSWVALGIPVAATIRYGMYSNH